MKARHDSVNFLLTSEPLCESDSDDNILYASHCLSTAEDDYVGFASINNFFIIGWAFKRHTLDISPRLEMLIKNEIVYEFITDVENTEITKTVGFQNHFGFNISLLKLFSFNNKFKEAVLSIENKNSVPFALRFADSHLHIKSTDSRLDLSWTNELLKRQIVLESNDYHSRQRRKGIAGHIDTVENSTIKGWAIHEHQQNTAAILYLFIDNQFISEQKATLFRADLKENNLRDGFAAFEFDIPLQFQDGISHNFYITDANFSDVLPGFSEFCLYNKSITNFSRMQLFYESCVLSIKTSANKIKNKVAIVCSYFEPPFFSSFHRHLFASLRELGYWVLCVHSTPNKETVLSLPEETDCLILKRNTGYDFGSWLTGIYHISEHLPQLEQLLWVNDSSFGPLTDLAPILAKMNTDKCDFWGMTDSFAHTYHLQSYFLVFNKSVLNSGFFLRFGETFGYPDDKNTAINEGELSLTKKLIMEGFRPGVVFKYEEVAKRWLQKWNATVNTKRIFQFGENDSINDGEMRELFAPHINSVKLGIPNNPTHLFWDTLLELGFPFIKRELIYKNPMNLPNLADYSKLIGTYCKDYPLEHIQEASRFFPLEKIYL